MKRRRRRRRLSLAIYRRRLRVWFVHLLHLEDSTHSIALGAAIGMFIAFTPTVGIQMLLVVFVTWLIPANRTAGIPLVWITNPFTAVPIYTFNYEVGRRILGTPANDLPHRMAEIWNGSHGMFRKMGEAADFLTKDFAWPLWLGSLIVGGALGVISYIVMYYTVDFYRRRHRARLDRKRLRAAEVRQEPAEGTDSPASGDADP